MLYIIMGKSGAGKDTILQILNNEFNLDLIIQTTSRPKRDNEVEGLQYYFKSKKEYEKLIKEDKMLEYRTYETNFNNKKELRYYGVEKKSINKDKNCAIINVPSNIEMIKKEFPKSIFIYLELDDIIRKNRAMMRPNFDEYEWNRRLKADAIDFRDIKSKVDYVINNFDLNSTREKLKKILSLS